MKMRRDSIEKLLQLKTLWHQYRGRCQYCKSPTLLLTGKRFVISSKSFDGYDYNEYGEPWPIATRDHKIPISRGGPDVIDNMTLACSPCNHRKDSLTPEEFENVKAWGCDADLMFRQILFDVHTRQSRQPKLKKGKEEKQEPKVDKKASITVVDEKGCVKKVSITVDEKGCVWYRSV